MHQGQHGGKPRQTVPKEESTSKLRAGALSQKIDDLARSHGLRWLVRLHRMVAHIRRIAHPSVWRHHVVSSSYVSEITALVCTLPDLLTDMQFFLANTSHN